MNLTKEQAKKNLAVLVERFKLEFESGKTQTYNEEATKTAFIQPLLKDVLGWDVNNNDEVSPEERVSRDRVDYGLKINGKTVMFVEAKSVKADLNKHIEQAVMYGFNRRDVPFIMLTDFEGIMLFDTTIKPNFKNLKKGMKLDIPWKEYVSRFEELWVLSKESVLAGKLDELIKIKPKDRITIDKAILEDLEGWREKLAKDIYKNNHERFNSNDSDKDGTYLKEITQKILDRIIFMRFCEDRNLSNRPTLKSIFAERNEAVGTKAMSLLNEEFKHYNNIFNSDLFGVRDWDSKVIVDIKPLKEIILGTYDPYLFDVIPLEVLGNIYEQYLGYTIKLTEHQAKYELKPEVRKAGGVYYTPKYIVDYIVKNTVGKVLEESTPAKIKKLSILDPACGSGSFLIRAYEEMLNYYRGLKVKGDKILDGQTGFGIRGDGKERELTILEKAEILKRHIYGVDIDEQAVEVTKLSLMLKMLEGEQGLVAGRNVLPMLDKNIKCGNSLISGDSQELFKYFGKDYWKVKPFNWNEEFKQIMVDEGGFDVVVGNPPYVKARDYNEGKASFREYMNNSGQFTALYKMWDLYIPFIEKGLNIVKKNGLFGMIVPDTIEKSDYAQKIREKLLKEYYIYQINHFPESHIFVSQNKVIGIKNTIIFVQNSKSKAQLLRVFHEKEYSNIKSEHLVEHDQNLFKQTALEINVFKVETVPLGDLCYASYGLRLNSDKANKKFVFKKSDLLSESRTKIHTTKYTEGKYLSRYLLNKTMWLEWGTERCPGQLVRPTFPELYKPEKILIGRQTKNAVFDNSGIVVDNTIIVCFPYVKLKEVNNSNINKYYSNMEKSRSELEKLSENISLKCILGILNSKLIKYYIRIVNQGNIDMFPDDWKKLPIPISVKRDTNISKSVERLIDLKGKEITAKGNEKDQIQRQIDQTDKEIDELVYKHYGITEEERKVIEVIPTKI